MSDFNKQLYKAMRKQNMLSKASEVMRKQDMLSRAAEIIRQQMKQLKT